MNRTIVIALSILATVVGTTLVAPAGPKNDGRPDGGTLADAEYGRPATLDPVTSEGS